MKNSDVNNYDWESLPVGETVRIHCSHYLCEHKKDSLTITRTPDGAVFNCFRCHSKGFVGEVSNPRTARHKLKRLREGTQVVIPNTKRFRLPKDFINIGRIQSENNTNLIPKYITGYLYKYGLYIEQFIRFNIGYSHKYDGIIFPIYEDSKLVAYLIRFINKDYKYKLITPELIYNFNNNYKLNKRIVWSTGNSIPQDVHVLCEDIISAIRIYEATGFNVIALLTTSLPPLNYIPKDHRIIIWLDYDAKFKALRHSQHLNFNGYRCQTLITEKDPKEYKPIIISNKLYEKLREEVYEPKQNP